MPLPLLLSFPLPTGEAGVGSISPSLEGGGGCAPVVRERSTHGTTTPKKRLRFLRSKNKFRQKFKCGLVLKFSSENFSLAKTNHELAKRLPKAICETRFFGVVVPLVDSEAFCVSRPQRHARRAQQGGKGGMCPPFIIVRCFGKRFGKVIFTFFPLKLGLFFIFFISITFLYCCSFYNFSYLIPD